MILSIIICVPDWPWFNRHPVKWLESVPDRRAVNVTGSTTAGGGNTGDAGKQ